MVHVMSEVNSFYAADDFTGEPCVLLSDFDAQRLRADTAEAELAKANDKIDKAWRRSHELDNKAYIPGAFDAWKRPVPQFLPYDFSGNPGTNATQYCNGWNDCGGYWKAHATEVEAKLATAEQRITSMTSVLRLFADCADVRQVGTSAMAYVGALNPNPEAESHDRLDDEALQRRHDDERREYFRDDQ